MTTGTSWQSQQRCMERKLCHIILVMVLSSQGSGTFVEEGRELCTAISMLYSHFRWAEDFSLQSYQIDHYICRAQKSHQLACKRKQCGHETFPFLHPLFPTPRRREISTYIKSREGLICNLHLLYVLTLGKSLSRDLMRPAFIPEETWN